MQKLPVPQSAQAPADAFTGSVLHEALRGPMEEIGRASCRERV